MTEAQRNEMLSLKDEFYMIDRKTEECKTYTICLEDIADKLIEKLSGKKVLDDATYDYWLERIYNNFEYAVAYWYGQDYELPDVENKLLLEQLRKQI